MPEPGRAPGPNYDEKIRPESDDLTAEGVLQRMLGVVPEGEAADGESDDT